MARRFFREPVKANLVLCGRSYAHARFVTVVDNHERSASQPLKFNIQKAAAGEYPQTLQSSRRLQTESSRSRLTSQDPDSTLTKRSSLTIYRRKADFQLVQVQVGTGGL